MIRQFLIAWGVVAAVCGCWLLARTNRPVDFRAESQRLQGTWVVISVQRNGALDPTQVGALLTFEQSAVRFKPKERPPINLADGTS
jgi:hypothetical protein